MSDYRFPYKDVEFLLNHVLDFDRRCADAGLDEIRGQYHKMFVDPDERESSAYREFWEQLRRGEFLGQILGFFNNSAIKKRYQ